MTTTPPHHCSHPQVCTYSTQRETKEKRLQLLTLLALTLLAPHSADILKHSVAGSWEHGSRDLCYGGRQGLFVSEKPQRWKGSWSLLFEMPIWDSEQQKSNYLFGEASRGGEDNVRSECRWFPLGPVFVTTKAAYSKGFFRKIKRKSNYGHL